jgi:hypothetical protein
MKEQSCPIALWNRFFGKTNDERIERLSDLRVSSFQRGPLRKSSQKRKLLRTRNAEVNVTTASPRAVSLPEAGVCRDRQSSRRATNGSRLYFVADTGA